MHKVLSGGGQGKYNTLAKPGACQPLGSKFGMWAGQLFKTIPAACKVGAGVLPRKRIFTAACRSQKQAASEPMKVKYRKFRPWQANQREGSGRDGWGQVVPFASFRWPPVSQLADNGPAMILNINIYSRQCLHILYKCPKQQTLYCVCKGKLSPWI